MAASMIFYVTVDGDRIEGPFETRDEAKAVADDLMTHEVNLSYSVEAVDE